MPEPIEEVHIWLHPDDANRILAEWTRPGGGGDEPPDEPPAPDVHVTSRDATDAPDRMALEAILARNTSRAHRGTELAAVLVIQLDDFQDVHDLYGEDAAFEVVVAVAERVAAVRGTTAFHLGDDMFIVVTGPLRSRFDALAVARRVQRRIAQPFAVDGREIGLSASIGVRVSLNGARDPAELVLDAGVALDEAKRRGRGETVLFSPELLNRAERPDT
jgi:diguanylate cyclase (GGDEF)-like protein